MGNASILRYGGSFRDPVTGGFPLGNGYRTYIPGLMRFTAPDDWSPFGAGGLNCYAYCGEDPVNSSDPSGHLRFRFRFSWSWSWNWNGNKKMQAPYVGGGVGSTAVENAEQTEFEEVEDETMQNEQNATREAQQSGQVTQSTNSDGDIESPGQTRGSTRRATESSNGETPLTVKSSRIGASLNQPNPTLRGASSAGVGVLNRTLFSGGGVAGTGAMVGIPENYVGGWESHFFEAVETANWAIETMINLQPGSYNEFSWTPKFKFDSHLKFVLRFRLVGNYMDYLMQQFSRPGLFYMKMPTEAGPQSPGSQIPQMDRATSMSPSLIQAFYLRPSMDN